MKKKLLLIVLPALMALSGCSGISNKPIEKVENNSIDLIAEDNLAHEEVFGGVEAPKDLRVRKLGNPEDMDDIKLGVQSQFNANGEGTGDDTVSLRFIAAIKYTNVSAHWTRGLANGDGSEGVEKGEEPSKYRYFTFSDSSVHESTKYYTTLSNGGLVITAGSGDYVGYVGFVVYTMVGIPYESFKSARFAAYLTLTDNDSVDPLNPEIAKTDVCVATVEQTLIDMDDDSIIDASAPKIHFSFANNASTKYFLYGSIGSIDSGAEKVHLAELKDGGTNVAEYNNFVLAVGDYFGSFYYDGDHFKFFSYRDMFNNIYGYLDESTVKPGYATPFVDGTYDLLVSRGTPDHMYIHVDSWDLEHYPLYLKPNADWKKDGARFAVYAFNDSTDTKKWYDLADTDGDGVYYIEDGNDFDEDVYEKIIFCRMDGSNSTNGWGSQKWNQTSDLLVSDLNNGPCLVCEITGWDNSSRFTAYSLVR